ncbi:Endochitinase 1 [Capsicum chinense]|nr:Endochitinase 1 [Capsicum chinense]
MWSWQENRVQDRIGFYWRYCGILGVSPSDKLDCGNQRSFGNGLLGSFGLKMVISE